MRAIKPIRQRFLSARKRVNKWTAKTAETLQPSASVLRRLEDARRSRDAARNELAEIAFPEILARYLERDDLLIATDDDDDEDQEEAD